MATLVTSYINNTNNSSVNIYQNLYMIDWQDIEWNILSNIYYARIRNINDEFVELNQEQLDAFAFPDIAIDSQGLYTDFPVKMFIPLCGCNECNSFIEFDTCQIRSNFTIYRLLLAIYNEYEYRNLDISILCKNDLNPTIKRALTSLSSNCYAGKLKSVMGNLIKFSNIVKDNNDYYLILKKDENLSDNMNNIDTNINNMNIDN